MSNSKIPVRFLGKLCFLFILLSCDNSPTCNSNADSSLNGSWVSGVQTGFTHIYITELRFNNGKFEWAFDDDLQQRGVYDTKDGVLTVTIENNYGSPQRLLRDHSGTYSIVGDTLTWCGGKYYKK